MSEGINYHIQITAHTKFGSSIHHKTEAWYNTFDDMLLYFMENNDYEYLDELPEEVTFHKGVLTIVDERNEDCTFSYRLVLPEAKADDNLETMLARGLESGSIKVGI